VPAAAAHQDPPEGVQIRIDTLVLGESPRRSGVDPAHVRTLAEVETLPPILVDRTSLRVIDGFHRVHAARLRGAETIAATVFDGDPDAAFLLAVQANIAHGLPLSRADRNNAAQRIIAAHPGWSDRMISSYAGLSPKTIAAIRRRSSAEIPQLPHRVGRDGRTRSLTRDRSRSIPQLRLVDGPSSRGQAGEGPPTALTSDASSEDDLASLLLALRKDPSIRLTEAGRVLLRILGLHMIDEREWNRLAASVPDHALERTVKLTRGCAARWAEFGDALAARRRTNT
jgi:hypothetical protein